MPGPCNSKKKRKNQTKKEKRVKAVRVPSEPPPPPVESRPSSPLASLSRSYSPLSEVEPNERYKPIRSQPLRFNDNSLTTTRPIRSPASKPPRPERVEYEPQKHTFDALLQRPCVEDLGNGPHVNDISAFLDSRICAPPSLEDPLSAEFAQQEVLEMLCKILPEETAMIMWYNKSRLKSRVCPACKRLYHLGDNTKEPLVDAFDDESLFGTREMEKDQPRRKQSEQRISGICSALCFILVAYQYPAAIRSTWGRMAEELSDEVWEELDRPGLSDKPDKMGLSMMLKMTRCHDLGLGQLFFPGEDMEGQMEENEHSDTQEL